MELVVVFFRERAGFLSISIYERYYIVYDNLIRGVLVIFFIDKEVEVLRSGLGLEVICLILAGGCEFFVL